MCLLYNLVSKFTLTNSYTALEQKQYKKVIGLVMDRVVQVTVHIVTRMHHHPPDKSNESYEFSHKELPKED